MLATPALAADETRGPAAEADALVRRWVTLEQQRSALKDEASRREARAEAQLRLLEREEEELRRFIARAQEEDAGQDARRSELLAEQRALEAVARTLEERLPALLQRARDLRDRLPPPLAATWEKELAAVAEDDAPVNERLTALLAVLDQARAFADRIAVHQGVLEVDGAPLEVEQVYLGPARGWYVSADRRRVAAGRATPSGWRWERPDDPTGLAADVVELLEANRRAAALELVEIPVDLRAGDGP